MKSPLIGRSQSLAQPSCFPSVHLQQARLRERRSSLVQTRVIAGVQFQIFPGVYDTGVDTELMADVVSIGRGGNFLEVGCGSGAVALLLAKRGHHGIGVDINSEAVRNAECNRQRLGVPNVTFLISDVFDNVRDRFDVIVCNPPYNTRAVADEIDRMFWDPADEMKRRFFGQVRRHLRLEGRVFFGWADFADIDIGLPLRLAEQVGLQYVRHHSRVSRRGVHEFLVLEFCQARKSGNA